MEMKQIYDITNDITQEAIGDSAVLKEDLTNITDYGTAVFNAMSMDHFCKKLIDRIGKVTFESETYQGFGLPLYRSAWEYGAAMMTLETSDLDEATENESWLLTNGQSYDPNIFKGPTGIEARYYQKRTTFEIPLSLADEQVKSAFTSAEQVNSFFTMIQTKLKNSMTVKKDELAMRVVNSMIGSTLAAEFPSVTGDNYSNSTGVKAVNLLKLYNEQFTQSLTFAQAMFSPEFMRYASYVIKNYLAYLKRMSKCFNIKGYPQFTSDPSMILLSQFRNGVETYLESDTFHNQLVAIGKNNVTDVPYFQGSGTDFALGSATKIHVEVPDPSDETLKKEVVASGILGVMFDWKSCMINNNNPRVTSNYNGKAEFTNYWYKEDCSYVTRPSRNFIVFFAA